MKYIYLFLSALVVNTAQSQNLTDYIPADAQMVFSMNLQQLNTKSNQMDYSKYLAPLIRTATGYYPGSDNNCELISIGDMIKSPALFGINPNQNLYIYKSFTDNFSGTIFLFSLSDPRKFESNIRTLCLENKNMQVRSLSNGKVYAGKKTSVSYNNQMAAVMVKKYSYSDYSDADYVVTPTPAYDSTAAVEIMDDTASAVTEAPVIEEMIEAPVEGTYEEDSATILLRQEENNKKLEKISNFMEQCLQLKKESYTSNRSFYKLVQGNHDAFFYFNSLDMIYKSLVPFYRNYGYDGMMPIGNKSNSLLAGMNSTYTLDFENGKATINVLSNYNKNAYAYIEKSYDVKQSKKLFKYIDGKNLLGYMSFAFNAEEMAKFYGAFYNEIMSGVSDGGTYGESKRTIMQALELFYAFIDKDVLYNTLKSQAIFACTGFQDVRLRYTTYEYDEDFKPIEKTVESTEKMPKMVLATAIGNKENARKLFDIISKFTIFTRVRDNMFVYIGDRYTRSNIYFALTEDAFIVTNDSALALNNLAGYKADQQMDKAEKAVIMKHNACMKIYGSKMLAGINDAYFKKGETLPWFAQLMTSLGDIEMYDTKPTEGSYGMTAVLNLKDNSSNALYQLLKMMSSFDGH